MRIKRDSDWFVFIKNYIIAEILFFIGTGLLILMKMAYNLDVPGLLSGTFLGNSVVGLFGVALDQAQQDWIFSAIIIWPIHMFIAFLSSLLLLAGILALAILIPLQVEVFTGPNAIDALAIPVGLAFFIAWGIFPILYVVRSSITGFFKKFTGIFTGSSD